MRHAVIEAIKQADLAKFRRIHPVIGKYFPFLFRFWRQLCLQDATP
jgi:hypothetical protein